MAKREISSTLKNLKFMQRAAQREEKTKKQEEVQAVGYFFSPGTFKKCMVITEGDPHPGAVIGRMSFQSFNPSVDKLNEEATKLRCPETSGAHAVGSSIQAGRASVDEAECSDTAEPNCEANGNLKRKQSEAVPDTQEQNKSPKTVQGSQQSSANGSKGSFKQQKCDKLDWSVLRPKNQRNQNK